jgi:hypothetical protein
MGLLAPLSTPMHILPIPRTSSHSPSPSPDLTASPNIYVTYKVLQLLDTFRKRVKTRVKSGRILKKETSTRVTRHFCQDLERQAFEEIDTYLGRKTTAHSRKIAFPTFRYDPGDASERKPSEAKRTALATAVGQHRDVHSSSVEWYAGLMVT